MKHLGTVAINSENICLRRFLIEDASVVFNSWANDKDVAKYLTWNPHESIEETRSIIKTWINSYKNKDFYQWAICLDDNKPIGSISVVDLDAENESIYIGYCIGKKFWNQGYTSKSLKILIKFFFEEVQVKIIYAKHDIENINSGRVMKSAGMKYFKTEDIFKNNEIIKKENYYKISYKDYLNFSYNFD